MSYSVIRLCNPRNVHVGAGLSACVMGSSYADGCPGAPSGSPQFSTLLNSYGSGGVRAANGNQPQWNVPGIDYPVGPDAGVTLKDPWPGYPSTSNSALDAGLQAFTTADTSIAPSLTFVGNNLTIDGYDFTAHGGICISFDGTNNNLINCSVALPDTTVSGGHLSALWCGEVNHDLTMTNCKFDGRGDLGASRTTDYGLVAGHASMKFRYSWLRNGFAEGIVQTPQAAATFDMKYCLLENAGGWGHAINGQHGDWGQFYAQAAGGHWSSFVFDFNCAIQNTVQSSANTLGINICTASGNTTGYYNYAEMNNNVLVGIGATGPSPGGNLDWALAGDNTWCSSTSGAPSKMMNNYFDNTSVEGACLYFGPSGNGNGPYNGVMTQSGNISMLDGSVHSGNV